MFLSYRSVNRSWVLNLYDNLRQLGYKTFIDQCALTPGEFLARRLQKALGASQSGVLIWSRATADSEWVEREYNTLDALSMNKAGFRFVPIVLDGTDLPLFLKNRVYLDFSSYPDGPNGGELLRLVHGIAGKPLSEEAAHFAAEQDEAAQIATVQIRAALRNGRADRILEVAKAGGLPWDTSSTFLRGRGVVDETPKEQRGVGASGQRPAALSARRTSQAVVCVGVGKARRE